MAGSLWVSDKGLRRKGTSFQEIQSLFIEQITTKHIYEPLYSAEIDDDPAEVRADLRALDFDVAGIVNQSRNVVGFVRQAELNEPSLANYRPLHLHFVVTDSTSIHTLIRLLEKQEFLFVMRGNSIDGIITRADINKPIVRLYVFGLISLFEMHLNYWIDHYYPNDGWKNLIKSGRIVLAETQSAIKKGNNEALSLLYSLQFSDKRDILSHTKDFLQQFRFGKKKFDQMAKRVERIRNQLAHSQKTVHAGMEWDKFVNAICKAEEFLEISEKSVLADIQRKFGK
jgi:hypothetical protein